MAMEWGMLPGDVSPVAEWDVEEVQDFEDVLELPFIRHDSTGTLRGGTSDIGGSCSEGSFTSATARGPGNAEGVVSELDALNLDRLLQAWAAQEGFREEAAAAAAAGDGQISQAVPAFGGLLTVDPSHVQGPVPRVAMDWLMQVAQPSMGEETVDGVSVDSPSLRPPRLDGTIPSMRLFSPRGILHSFGGLSGDREASDTTTSQDSAYGHTEANSVRLAAGSETIIEGEEEDRYDEDVVSVFDMSDEPPSVRAALPADTRALLGDLQQAAEGSDSGTDGGALQEVLGVWAAPSPISRSPIASRPTTRERSESAFLENSFGNMLRRLALGNQLRDDDISRSVRRALQIGAVLPGGQGLSDVEIASLTQMLCQPSLERQQCSICLDMYQAGEALTVLPCGHNFHSSCVARWVQRCAHCPLCRTHCGLAAPHDAAHAD